MINENTLKIIQQYLPVIAIIGLTYALIFQTKELNRLQNERHLESKEREKESAERIRFWQDAYIRTDPARYQFLGSANVDTIRIR